MKKIILTIGLIACFILLKAQAIQQQGDYTGVYKWKEVVQMQQCDMAGNPTGSGFSVSSIVNTQRFVIVHTGNDFAVIKLWDYTIYYPHTDSNSADRFASNDIFFAKKINKPIAGGDNAKGANGKDYAPEKFYKARSNFFLYNFNGTIEDYSKLSATAVNTRNYGDKQMYFRVPLTYISQYAVKSVHIAGALALGAINYPFKYRLLAGRSDFSGSFNLGAAVGYKLPHDSLSKWTITTPLVAFSVSTVNIDSVSAQRNQAMLKSTNNFSAISFATGIIAENNKIQIGLFFGLDKISRLNNLQYGWIYQNKPWFSIGFGYSLFSSEKPSSKNDNVGEQQ